MFIPHSYAIQIESMAITIFNCDRGGLGGIVDADFIERHPFIVIIAVLGSLYNKSDNNKKVQIDNFINKYYWDIEKNIAELGQDMIEEIIEEFEKLM